MNPVLPEAAVDFGATAARAFAALGGVDAARRAEADPAGRGTEVDAALRAIGLHEIEPRADADTAAAAAVLCEVAGRVTLPYPLPAVLLRDEHLLPFAVVSHDRCRVDHGDLFPRWRVATLHGRPRIAVRKGDALGSRLGPFVADLVPEADIGNDTNAARDAALYLVLTAWQVLGATDRAVELAVEHVTDRVQFGKPLAAFQAVQFQLADAAVAVAGLRELAHFTLWRLTSTLGADGAAVSDPVVADVLALRLHALDVARTVLRTAQQLHGAAGVCDEYDVSVLARHLQPALRLPWGAAGTAQLLVDAVALGGFPGLFPHGGGA